MRERIRRMLNFGKYQYKTTCQKYTNCQEGEHEGYALVGRERFGRKTCMLADVTVSREVADRMVRMMNSHQVDLCQMQDVAEDLLVAVEMA